jgi:hemoglobin/transferrin/lactoferrin receptor protein
MSIFAQHTWAFSPDWKLVVGARQIYNETGLDGTNDPVRYPLSDSQTERLIGSAALLWTPTQSLTLRLGWGQGFITPTLLQAHTGTFFGSGFIVRPNPDLKAETSDSIEFGARWSSGPWRLDGTVFHTMARDYIATTSNCALVGVACAPGEITYLNVNAATSTGAEIAAGWQFAEGYEVYGNVGLIRREFEYETLTTTQSGVPKISGRFGLRYEGVAWNGMGYWWDAYLRGATKTAQASPGRGGGPPSVQSIDGWGTFNFEFGTTWKAPQGLGEHSLSVALTNITDERYRASLEELLAPGRAISINLRSKF